MKPYYKVKNVELYHGDYREVLPLLKEGSCDLLLTGGGLRLIVWRANEVGRSRGVVEV
jgi:hypothetical protein